MQEQLSKFFTERPKVVILIPDLANAVGVDKAIVLQQFNYVLTKTSNYLLINEQRHLCGTLADIAERYFPFWPVNTLRNYIAQLEKAGLLAVKAFGGGGGRCYRLRHDRLDKLYEAKEKWAFTPTCNSGPNSIQNSITPQILDADTSSEYLNSSSLNTKKEKKEGETRARGGTTPTAADFGEPQNRPTVSSGFYHPALAAIRQVSKHNPDPVLYPTITAALGDVPDVDRLAECFVQWRLNGYKATNYGWATDWYVNGIPGTPKGGKYGNRRPDGRERSAERDKNARSMVEQLEKRGREQRERRAGRLLRGSGDEADPQE